MHPRRPPAPPCSSRRVGLNALVFFAGLMMVNGAYAQLSGSWYYCDPAHAYYPYISTCPIPWRAVTPYAYGSMQQPSAAPALPPETAPPHTLISPAEADAQPSVYQQGQADRQAWEIWFGTLTGDYRAGAEWWAGQRSLRSPGSCTAAPPSTGAGSTAGCFAAKDKLTPSDVRRKAEPEYRLGWNNPAPVASSPIATEDSGTPTLQTQTRMPSATQALAQTTADSQSRMSPSPTYSPTAGPVGAPVASQSSGEDRTPIRPQSSDEGWIVGAAVALIGGGGWAILRRYNTRRRRDKALRIIAAEVDAHAATLHVKRIQTVLPDDYGTVFLDKWQKEKDYFIKTRILPGLLVEDLGALYRDLAIRIDKN